MNNIGIPGLIVLTVLAVGAILLALFAGRDARISRHVIVRFVFRIVVPFVCVLGLPLVFIGQFIEMDARVWQALIAGVVIAAGWLTSAVFAEIGKSRYKDERLRDYHKALYAEIGNALRAMWDEGRSENITNSIVEKMEANPEFVPFIPREHHDHVFNALLDEIEVLPRQTIDAIVAYYSLIKSIDALSDDMRGDRFASLEQSRRIAIYNDYSAMRNQAFALGQHALRLIKAYSEGGAGAAERISDEINNPAAGQSDRSKGSE